MRLIVCPKCKIDNCNKNALVKGYCNKHYFYFKNKKVKCLVTNCVNNNNSLGYYRFSKGYCRKHYAQIIRHGSCMTTIYDKNDIVLKDNHAEIILKNIYNEEVGRAIIDLKNVNKVKNYKWGINSNGYAVTVINKKATQLHSILLKQKKDLVTDHINHNPLDNRIKNLRNVTVQANTRNTIISKKNTSGCVGVIWDKSRNKWRAFICLTGKYVLLGRFDNFEEAKSIRKDAEKKYFGEIIKR